MGGSVASADAVIVVDVTGLLTVRVGDETEPRGLALTDAEAMALLAQTCVELGRPISVMTSFSGGQVSWQLLERDGTMRDLPDPATAPAPVEASVVTDVEARPAMPFDGPDEASTPQPEPTFPAVVPVKDEVPVGRGFGRRRLVTIVAGAAAAAIVVAAVASVVRGGPDEANAVVDDSQQGERAWWPMGLPTVDDDPSATPKATAPASPTPTSTVTATPPPPTPTPTPTVTPDPPPPVPDLQPPSAPGGIRVSGLTATTMRLSWRSAADNVGVAGYEVYLNGGRVSTTGATSADLSGLVTATTYTIAVRAVDAAGNAGVMSSASASTVDGLAPSTPGELGIADRSGTALAVSWRAARDNVAVSGYVIYLNGRQVSTTGATSATVKGLAPATGYTISVAAVDAAGNVGERVSVEGTTLDSVAPSAPARVSAGDVRIESASISWSAATDNVRVTGYVVYLNGRRIQSTALQTIRLDGLKAGTDYTVSVAAVDAAGNVGGRASTTFMTMGLP